MRMVKESYLFQEDGCKLGSDGGLCLF